MGGGEGAKERRRLKRFRSPTATARLPVVKRSSLPSPLVKTNSFTSKKSNVQSKTDISDTFSDPPARKEKKVKKPKHLKRKLEQLSQDDQRTREIVLKEMAQFEEIKSKLAQKSKRKRSKSTHKENDQNATEATFTKDGDPKVQVDCDALKSNRNSNNSCIDVPVADNEATMAHELEDYNDADSDAGEKSKVNDDAPRRERGRRRRGRIDTAKQILETQVDVDSQHNDSVRGADKSQVPRTDEPQEMNEKDQKRYCIGRKPVTDFVMGQKYGGKVVYVKDFGVFFDIGCHSDAFCHVSRLGDDFVKNPREMFKEGDEVEVRVVEIDRKHKRITVSLQSDERIVDERASLEARAQRKKNRNESRRKSTNNTTKQEPSQDNTSKVETKDKSYHVAEKATVADGKKEVNALHSKDSTSRLPDEPSSSFANNDIDEKRARKLARRAARREQAA